MQKFVLAGAALVAMAIPSFAADFPVKAPAMVAAPSWAGIYAGVNVGYGWGDNAAAITANDPGAALIFLPGFTTLAPVSTDSTGLTAGLQIGYNWMLAPRFVFGAEADFQYSDIKDEGASVHTVLVPFALAETDHLRSFGTVRARLGYLVTDSLLLYATGGFAYGDVRQTGTYTNIGTLGPVLFFGPPNFTCPQGTPCFAGGDSSWKTGWTVGGGGEWMLLNNLSLKAEYLYMNLGSRDAYLINATTPNGGPLTSSFTVRGGDLEYHLVRAGLNWHF